MAFRWRPRPKPKPRPVKTKKPTDFNIRESGTSLGELVPTQPLLDIPSPKTTDLPVPKTGLADTPEGKEAVKKIVIGPEISRRTANKTLMGVLQQLLFPTPIPKFSKTKAPVPVPKVKTGIADWNTMKEDLEEIIDNQIYASSHRLLDDLHMKIEDKFYSKDDAPPANAMEYVLDFDTYAMDITEEVVERITHDIMNWKVRENPKLVQDLINNWKKAAKIQNHHPGSDEVEIGVLDYQDNIAGRIQDLIEKDLMTGFDKYKDTKKYNEGWFKKTAKNLESIPNSPPPFKTSHEMFIHNSKADALMDQMPDNPSPSQVKQTTLWGDANYEGSGRTLPSTRAYPTGKIQREDLPMSYSYPNEQNWLTKAEGPIDQPITRKIIDDSFESARNRLGNDYLNTIELSLGEEGKNYLPLRSYFGRKNQKEISEGGVSIPEVASPSSRATKYITDKELKYLDNLDNLFDKYADKDLELYLKNYKKKLMLKDKEDYRKVRAAADKFLSHSQGKYGDTLLQIKPTKEEVRKRLEVLGYAKEIIENVLDDLFTTSDSKGLSVLPDKITEKITEVQTTPDPVTKGLSVLSDDITEKITEVQTTPDPVTGAIDKKITELEAEAEFQDRQAQEAKTVKDVKDKFLSRRQLLFPRNKNTGGLVGLY